jgi:DNA-binding transcriptional LysR family regulator
VLPRAIERFQHATPSARLELADLSAQEMIQQAADGRLDLVITAAHETTKMRGFQWTEIRRIPPVLVLPAKHPLARLKRIPPPRLRDLPLLGFSRVDYPEYASGVRAALRPFGVAPRFTSLTADGLSSLLTALETQMCGAVLGETVAPLLPASLVARPFFPALEATRVVAGVAASRPNSRAEALIGLLREEAARAEAV